ncbi:SNF2-related protein [Dechloromonas sp. ARDL1]|uniref:SNF2-related protein n=1 Tax=Dechloromonas sp. ARDL1 TaxID=3322121 RepID=UPI003DA74625
MLTKQQSRYFAWQLTRRAAPDTMDLLASTLVDAQVDLNPHQVDAALFACRNPLSRGVILADEVGLGKTIEAGLVIAQHWAERRRNILIIVPANLRKQWYQELREKFALESVILETKSYNAARKNGEANPFCSPGKVVLCSYQFAKAKADDIRRLPWDLVVFDEAHRLRNVYKTGNVIARTLKDAVGHAVGKVLLTATPLQNSLLELYGLVSMIDERVFGDLDSFRQQFGQISREQTFADLRARLSPVCLRTLRRQVQLYVPYTRRIPIVEEFIPTSDEIELTALVSDYLRRPDLKALPNSQRQLISLVLWKLLASSTHAIAGALGAMADRLEKMLGTQAAEDIVETFNNDYEALNETADEWDSDESALDGPQPERTAIEREMRELRHFQQLASGIRQNAKGVALLKALDKAFAELERLKAARKAIIFTESKRTQAYLLQLLAETPYANGVVLFNGTNSDERAQQIYRDWLKKHEGTDRISGSRTADTRAALVEYFRECDNPAGTIMIATEAGAEGINLQFCSLVINYDLPWNPQRIEQRIGRCHRYGQKHDVVVVNFVDLSNEADQRVYQLLAEKFQLFEGVFGASDEVLGAIGSGIDFERRIAEIYKTCRQHEEIKASFEQLQLDLSGEINQAMVKTRQLLLENFDEEVQAKLRVRDEAGKATRGRYENLLLELTEAALPGKAAFDDHGFTLLELPSPTLAGEVPLGRYELPRRSGEAHLYRVGHPLAEWIVAQAKQGELPPARLCFDYEAYARKNGRITTLESLRGKSGQLQVELLTVEALGRKEERLIVSAVDAHGKPVAADDGEKMLRLPASEHASHEVGVPGDALRTEAESRRTVALGEINQRNLSYFEAEVQKLDAWADDLKLGLEQELKELDRQIKDVRREASSALTLEEKINCQKRQRDLEQSRNRKRRDMFDRQDQIDDERGRLIDELQAGLAQKTHSNVLFFVAWELR